MSDPEKPCEYWFGTRVQGAGTDSRTGERLATSDPRNEVGGVDRSGDLGAFGQVTPRILSLSLVPRKFAVGDGTTFNYSLSGPARVVFRIHRVSRGRHTLVFARRSKAGSNSKKFSSRIGDTTLKPGRYRATLVATSVVGVSSKPRRVIFRVVEG